MSRREEFHAGATFKHVGVGGVEHVRNAVDATYPTYTQEGAADYDPNWYTRDPDEMITKDHRWDASPTYSPPKEEWSPEEIRLVEAERAQKHNDWND